MRTFLDTNVLVYMFDGDAPDKQRIARHLYETGVASGVAVLSTQVLQEFYVTVTRKLGTPLPEADAESLVRDMALLPVVQIDAPLVLAAIGRSRRLRLSLWDALIVEAAITGGATTLYTEDLQNGLQIDGMTIENPFRSGTIPES